MQKVIHKKINSQKEEVKFEAHTQEDGWLYNNYYSY